MISQEHAHEMLDALRAIEDSASDGRKIPEWLQERMLAVHLAIEHVEKVNRRKRGIGRWAKSLGGTFTVGRET